MLSTLCLQALSWSQIRAAQVGASPEMEHIGSR